MRTIESARLVGGGLAHFRVVTAICCLLIMGCQSRNTPNSGERRYALKGTVVQVDKPQQHLVIDSEEIPGFMAAMTMPYPVADAKVLDQVSDGDQITADVVVANGSSVQLENVVVVKKAPATKPQPTGQAQPNEGVAVPNFALVNQDGKRTSFRQYAGKTVLLTFIYTRCPLPDYCPLATHNFAVIDKQLAETPALYSKTHLLSVSFDPAYDTPEVLRKYARAYVPDRGSKTFTHWEFASVPSNELSEVTKFFDIFYNKQDGQITHSMSTAIISPDGKLVKQYDGNDWKPDEVTADLVAAIPGANPAHLQASAIH